MYSMAIVPLYDTLGVEACNFIINQGKSLRAVILPHPTPLAVSICGSGTGMLYVLNGTGMLYVLNGNCSLV